MQRRVRSRVWKWIHWRSGAWSCFKIQSKNDTTIISSRQVLLVAVDDLYTFFSHSSWSRKAERKFHAGFKAIDFRFQKPRISLNTQKDSRSSTLLFLFSFLLGIVQPVTSKHVPCHVLGLEVKFKKNFLDTRIVPVVGLIDKRCNRINILWWQTTCKSKLQLVTGGKVVS